MKPITPDQKPAPKPLTLKPKAESLGWELQTPGLAYESKYFCLRRDEVLNLKREPFTYAYLDHPGSVFIAPFTKGGRFILIRSYRYPVDELVWGIPCGSIGDQGAKSLEEIARIEMKEEAGVEGGKLIPLKAFYTAPGVLSLKAMFFLATDVKRSENRPEDGELIIDIVEKRPEEVRALIRSEELWDAESACALLLAMDHLKDLGKI